MTYRREIDGLRAIAVISVLIYHAKFDLFGGPLLTGGFVGVDIFFVISGYLITRLILAEIEEHSSFSFLNFYERRARRILPMLFLVMFASLPFAWKILLPVDFMEYSESIISAILFCSNVFFYFATTEYGADSALLKPFLHTWSLGVEEQFYIVFPIILILINSNHFLRKHWITIVLFLMLLSFQFSVESQAEDPELAFFLPFSRFWEMLAGSILAFFDLKYGRLKSEVFQRVFPIFGMYLIMYSLISFDEKTAHPSWVTLLPVLGVSIVIVFASPRDLVGKVLGSRLFVATGLVSYSAYLWHFPLFAFARLNNAHPSNYDKLAWISITFAMSAASYFAVEKPFRNKSKINTRAFVSVTALAFFLLISSMTVIRNNEGIPSRMPAILLEDFTEIPWQKLRQDDRACHDRLENFCYFSEGDISNKSRVILVGDSHMASLSTNLYDRLKTEFNYQEINIGGCPFILNTFRKDVPYCNGEIQQRRLKAINESVSTIVIGADWPSYSPDLLLTDNEKTIGENFVATIRQLLDGGNKIVLVYPIPKPNINVPRAILSEIPQGNVQLAHTYLADNPLTFSLKKYYKETSLSFEMLDQLQDTNIVRVYPHTVLCHDKETGRCWTHNSESVFYFDDNHLTYDGADLVNRLIVDGIYEVSKQ
ncbi:acyltransferase [Luminiphilus sp.]|nr:acyltransferase [Luminiphilus sp.]